MAAETRLAAVLFGSFLLWLPALTAFLRGDLDAGAVGIRFAGAVAVVWAGIAVVGGVLSGYRTEPMAVADDGALPRRRAADPGSETAATAEGPVTTSVSDASGG